MGIVGLIVFQLLPITPDAHQFTFVPPFIMLMAIANVVDLDSILLPFGDFDRVEFRIVGFLSSGSARNLRFCQSSVVLSRTVAEVVSHCFCWNCLLDRNAQFILFIVFCRHSVISCCQTQALALASALLGCNDVIPI